MVELASWLTALPVLLAAAAITWAVSVVQRNVTIVDTLWPVLFILAAVTYAAAGPAGPRAWLLVALVDCGEPASRSTWPGAISATTRIAATRRSASATSRISR